MLGSNRRWRRRGRSEKEERINRDRFGKGGKTTMHCLFAVNRNRWDIAWLSANTPVLERSRLTKIPGSVCMYQNQQK
jgi:hypothetical protein